jgi:predicted ATP-grasp superfamily ATP-dependent carboligase
MPAVVLRVTEFPLQHGALGVFRSLGRAGVSVHAVVAERDAPVTRSRYLGEQVIWQPHRGESADTLVERLVAFGQRLGTRSMIVATGDDMALFSATRRAELEEYFVLPAVDPGLPAALADKRTLENLCREHGAPTLRSFRVNSQSQLDAAIDELQPPVVVKSLDLRGPARNVESTVLVPDRSRMSAQASAWKEPFGVLVQEYLPDDVSEDWITHGYRASDGTIVVFAGRKIRSFPVKGGSTAAGYVAENPELVRLAADFCTKVGFRGIFDIDWRLDRRDGQHYLLDFNPRVGAQFRMFEDLAGIDVVRAMHLDMSGRAIPSGVRNDGERFIVEPWDLASMWTDRTRPWRWPGGAGRPRAAWLAPDDVRPVGAALAQQLSLSVKARLRHRH